MDPEQENGQGANRSFYLPRLSAEFYQGDAVVHWTLPIAHQGKGWLNDTFHAQFREIMLHAAARESLFCPTYCLMPDHLHFVWMGLRLNSNQLYAMRFLRRYLSPSLRPSYFQHQPHDHVLREKQRKRNVFSKVCSYIIDNACNEGLVKHPEDWPFCGAIVPGYPTLHPLGDDFWPLFWKLYFTTREPEAGNIARPPWP
jgi:REP element-mobilizing transposase RayT